jgi:hypothetical protein
MLFTTIGYSSQESTGSRSKPTFEKESQRFRAILRRKNFLNPSKLNPVFESLDGDNKLSEAMKSFTSLAQASRIDYIKKKLSSKEQMGVTHLIPVTADEEEKQSTESSMSKKELLSVIQTLLGSLNEANHPQFKRIKSKSKDELLSILQQVKDLYNGNDNNEAEDMI